MLATKTARDCMSGALVLLRPEMDALEAMRVLIEQRISGAPVVDRTGNLVGMMTERDCMRVALAAGYHGDYGGRVADIMRTAVDSLEPDTPLTEIAERFVASPYRRLPVVDDGRVVGIVTRRDVLRNLEAGWQPDRHRI